MDFIYKQPKKNICVFNKKKTIRSFYRHYVAVLLGTRRPYLNVGGPHDQVMRVADLVPVSKTNIIMLRLEEHIKITRYVRPALFLWK